MPGWHEATREPLDSGKLQVAGIIQEQHPDRCRLFMQWKQMDWPVMVDSLNLLDVKVVPITVAIDEHGIVRLINPRPNTLERAFLDKSFEAPSEPVPAVAPVDVAERRAVAERENSAASWRQYGDALLLPPGEPDISGALEAYQRAVSLDSTDGRAHFRLGVAYRKRFDAGDGGTEDFARAVRRWGRALSLDPNQYIWRRRIQQYGPRLDKPYPFYDWVEEARREIAARGETPVPLTVEPKGAELAVPLRDFEARAGDAEPDSGGAIERDDGSLVVIESVVVPPTPSPGESVRVHLLMRPNAATGAKWNNESGPGELWITPPDGWKIDRQHWTQPMARTATSTEPRTVEFELLLPDRVTGKTVAITGYALYYACRGEDGACLYRRQDVTIPLSLGR